MEVRFLEEVESSYAWDRRLGTTGRYRNVKTGQVVSMRAVRLLLDELLDKQSALIEAKTQALIDGRVSLSEWQLFIESVIPNVHLAATALAKGGWAQMRETDYRFAQEQIRFNLEKLQGFAIQIEQGTWGLDGRTMRRARMYGDAARTTYHLRQLGDMVSDGFDEARSVRTVRDSCAGCVEQARLNWQPISQIIPIGMRNCLTNDRCYMEYRNSETGATERID